MPIIPLTRIVSGISGNLPQRTFVALDRATAIAEAREDDGLLATNISRVTVWPELQPYTNDNSLMTLLFPTTPAYVWDSFTTTPQIRYFAVASTQFTLTTGEALICILRVFCDNAHDARIDVFDLSDGDLFRTMTPAANLIDGSLDPNAGTADDVPFNWLNVRHFSSPTSLLDAVPPSRNGHSFQVVLSFEAVNYNSPDPSLNPAGLAFVCDIYRG
jgi:hypothetical protein